MKSTMIVLALVAGAAAAYGQNPLTSELKAAYNDAKGNITKSADRMADADYAFKPAGNPPRTFAQVIGHIADVQMAICGMVKGEQKMGNVERTKTSKADLVAALKESFDYCDSAYDSLTDATATQTIKMFGRDQTKLGALYGNLLHDSEMYGQIVMYYRAKNMVPPSTSDRPQMGKKKQ